MGKNKTEVLECKVCGDRAYGKHYGVYSCDGCSCFFKRTVRKRLLYSCTVGLQQCVVTRSKRNWCAFCRFKKCLEVNMNAHAVQKERGPRKKFINSVIPSAQSEEYELSAEILLSSIKHARRSSTLSHLSRPSQNSILSTVWAPLFLLEAAFWPRDILRSLKPNQRQTSTFVRLARQNHLFPQEISTLQRVILSRHDLVHQHQEIQHLEREHLHALITFPGSSSRLAFWLVFISKLIQDTKNVERELFSPVVGNISVSAIVTRI